MSNKRYLYMILATLTMLVSGLMYNLTVFYTPISSEIGCSYSSIVLAFSLSQIMFCFGGLILGFVYNRLPINITLIIAALGLSGGLFLSSQIHSVFQLYVTYSIVMNLCCGFLYKAVLAIVIPWFNDKPGKITGIMMMGAGLTAFVFNVPTTKLITLVGWRNSMRVLSLITFIICILTAVILKKKVTIEPNKNLKHDDFKDEVNVETKDMIKNPKFWIFFTWSVLLLAGCTSVTGNSIGISSAIGLSATLGAYVSMGISFSNALSRLCYGTLYDKYGKKVTMMIATTFFIVGSICINYSLNINNMIILLLGFFCLGFAFGGVPTIASTFILKEFGRKNYASNFSVQGMYSLLSPILGSSVFSLIYGFSNSYKVSLFYIIIYSVIALLMFIILNRYEKVNMKRG